MRIGDKLNFPFVIEHEIEDQEIEEAIIHYIKSKPYVFKEGNVIIAIADVDDIRDGRAYMTVTHVNKEYYENK